MPERLGRYTLGDKLGEGGMGVVYRAEAAGAEGFAKIVAIKTIHDALVRDPGIREMFVTEARTAQRLHHGNIVQIIDVGVEAGVPYLVLEYIDGISLAELLRSLHARAEAGVPIGDALYIAEQVASALAYAHGLTDSAGRPDGVVHRDVTPRNILLSRDGVVKLADFGIAKALAAPSYTVPGTFKGSLGYLAPEQARGEPVDARADQFAAGIVLHEMLAGKNPIAARDIERYHAALANGVPPLEAVDAALAAIVARATAIDPAARYASMNELRADLEAWRVAAKVRTSNDSLRDTLRGLSAETATVPSGRALGDVLALISKAHATRAQRPTAIARARRWRWPALALGLCAAGVIAYVLGTSRASTDARATVDAATADARSIASASDAARAEPPAMTGTGAFDAGVVPTSHDAAVAAPVDAARVIAVARKGRLRVNVVPWATVSLDGVVLGGVPIDVEVAAGPHRIVLHNPDLGQRVEKPIRIETDGTVEVTAW